MCRLGLNGLFRQRGETSLGEKLQYLFSFSRQPLIKDSFELIIKRLENFDTSLTSLLPIVRPFGKL